MYRLKNIYQTNLTNPFILINNISQIELVPDCHLTCITFYLSNLFQN